MAKQYLYQHTPIYDVSEEKTFVIASGVSGAAVAAVDLGANYTVLAVTCEDAGGIDAASTMSAQVDWDESGNLVALYEQNDPATLWSKSVPDTGTFGFVLTHAIGVRRLRFVLSKVSTADVTIKVRGLDAGQ